MKQTEKNKTLFQAVGHAIDGLLYAFKTERNMRIHVALTLIVLGLSIFLPLVAIEWVLLTFVIGLVLICELINTIIENMVDEMTQNQFHQWAKHVKDMGSGMVTISAIVAIVTACFILLPKILAWIS